MPSGTAVTIALQPLVKDSQRLSRAFGGSGNEQRLRLPQWTFLPPEHTENSSRCTAWQEQQRAESPQPRTAAAATTPQRGCRC
ncbi:MAG UNVERIFIED_CONTAM: hypothetical protein LVR18_15620 [Planctomycetaceae bacterium]